MATYENATWIPGSRIVPDAAYRGPKYLALAIVDDVEQWRHSRQRFSVAY